MSVAEQSAPTRSSRPPGGVSVVHITHRRQPAYAWFVDSLASQLEAGADIEVLFIDGLYGRHRATELERIIAGRFPFRHLPPKPAPWNGPHRLTRGQYWAISSVRNTGIVHATKPYLVFVDDLCVLMPGWWQQVKDAAREGVVVAGAYQKHYEMIVRDGILVSSLAKADGIDCRWQRGNDLVAVPIGGVKLFGAGIGAPRALLVGLNGFDELCDPVGGEDYHLGLRIEWAGVPIHYRRGMLAIESQELHRQPQSIHRLGKTVDPRGYMRRLREFGVKQRSTDGGWDAGHMILDILLGTRTLRTMGNYYDLATLTEFDLPDTVVRFPRSHWFDHQPLSAL